MHNPLAMTHASVTLRDELDMIRRVCQERVEALGNFVECPRPVGPANQDRSPCRVHQRRECRVQPVLVDCYRHHHAAVSEMKN